MILSVFYLVNLTFSSINSPQEVEKYLSKLYNDYMKLPPIESRYDGIEEFTFVDERTL